MDVNGLAFQHGAAGERAMVHWNRMTFQVRLIVASETVVCDALQKVALWARYTSCLRFAQARCRFDERLQHGLQIECRAADDLEHIGGRGLLLQ